jgi:hypothetical protein
MKPLDELHAVSCHSIRSEHSHMANARRASIDDNSQYGVTGADAPTVG